LNKKAEQARYYQLQYQSLLGIPDNISSFLKNL